MEHVAHPFAPVVDPNCHTLILGSFPSVKSRKNAFYYGHPQNRFWRMLAAVFQEELPADIPAKKALLLRHGIALWDVIASCEIHGSSDASVRNAVPVDIAQITEIADIRRVICNGTLAAKLYSKHLKPIMGMEALTAPSTSPANAAWSLDRLTGIWQPLLTNTEGRV
ncbi:MAG: DNA-deoxyinosine glycosylase [Clostridia bacterium]|nr:DNA-deoxyinosine glycosylase [Clostridia bacterium]